MPLRFFAISQKIFEMSERCNNSACFSVENKSCADISVTFVVYAYSNPIGNICLYNGEKKKSLLGRLLRALMQHFYPTAVLKYISRPPFSMPL